MHFWYCSVSTDGLHGSCYFSVSTRIDLKEETRIKVTSDEAVQWVKESKSKGVCSLT